MRIQEIFMARFGKHSALKDPRLLIKSVSHFLPAVFVALLWLAKDFPARMSSDSITSWDQVINGNYKNDHLVFYTLYLKLLSLDGHVIWLVPTTQIFLTIFMFDKILRIIGCKPSKRGLILFFLFLTPIVGGFVVTMWKDVPFTVFVILGSAYFAQYIKLEGKRDLLLGFFFFTAGISFRHNGWVLAFSLIFFVYLFLGLKVPGKLRLKIAGFVLASIFVSQSISALAIELTNASREPEYVYSLTFAADLAYIASSFPEKADPELMEIVSRFSNGESFEGAKNCTAVGYMIIPQGFSQEGLAENAGKVFSVWVKNLKSNYKLILEARKCRALPFIPPPLISHPVHPTWLFPGIYEPNSFGLESNDHKHSVLNLLQNWEDLWQKYALVVAWPAALGFLGIFFNQVLNRRKPHLKEINSILNALVLASLVPLWFVTISPDYRFAAIAQFLGIFNLVLAIQIQKK
jgi:hypothetical protein